MCVKRRIVFVMFVQFFIACLFVQTAMAKSVVVTGNGESESEAVRDALRIAVESAVGTIVDSATLVENYAVIHDQILTQSQGFVQDYQVLDKGIDGGVYFVKARVDVDVNPNSDLYNALKNKKLIKNVLRNPRIAVIIPEYHLQARVPDPAGETAVTRKLLDAGFKLVDGKQVANLRYSGIIEGALNNNMDDIRHVIKSLGVDYVVVGEAFSESAGDVMGRGGYSGILSCKARLEAKIIKADTAEVIAANGTYGTAADITEFMAAKKALNNAGEAMGDYIISKLLAGSMEQGIQIVIKNVANYNQVNTIESNLQNINGVKSTYIRDYSYGTATIDVDSTIAPQVIFNALQKLVSLDIQLNSVSQSSIEIGIQ